MSGKRRKYTPESREQAARLVIETGRPVAHVAAEIGVGEQVLGRWVCLQRQAAAAGDTGAVLDATNARSWSGCAMKTPNMLLWPVTPCKASERHARWRERAACLTRARPVYWLTRSSLSAKQIALHHDSQGRFFNMLPELKLRYAQAIALPGTWWLRRC
jgi:transposase-like protein